MSRRQQFLDALTAACREHYESRQFPELWKWVDCDRKAVRYAPVTGHVAYRLDCPDREALYHLQGLYLEGKVLRDPPEKARGRTVCWWPVGLWAELTSDT